MVTEAPVTQTPSAADSTPPSDERETLTLPTGDGQAAPGEEGKPAQDADAKPGGEPAKPAEGPERGTPEYYEAIQAKVDAGDPISTAEREDYRTEVQRQTDRNRAVEQQREQVQKIEREVTQALTGFGTKVHQVVADELTNAVKEGRQPSPTILTAALDKTVEGMVGNLTPFVMFQHDASIKDAVKDAIGAGMANQRELDALEGASHTKHVETWGQIMYRAGQRNSADGKKLADLTKQVGDQQAEIEKLTTQLNGKGSGPSADGKPGGNGGTSWTTKAEARNLHANGKITNAEMRRINNDRSIPDGY